MSDEFDMPVDDVEDIQGDDFIDEQPLEDDDIAENDDENENRCETRFDIVDSVTTYENYYNQKKETKPFLTKFERAKIIGIRAEMIANGSVALVTVPRSVTSAYEIAKLEFNERRIPLMIRRYLPNGVVEDWRLEDMVVFN
jgi:DNA-directed RNA polymerase I, II, and III subunit RPABC2